MPGSSWSDARFVAVNLWCTRTIPAGPVIHPANDLMLRTITAADSGRFAAIHADLRPGKHLSAWRKWLYRRAGSKLAWVLETAAPRFVGFNMYYFREGEWTRGIVHEAFIGVVAEYRGRRLADTMREAAAARFAAAGVFGISTRIHADNLPSLRSAERQGFRTVAEGACGNLEMVRRLR